ncbi:MAG TPA: thioredoxin domain-containing protein, partial [Gammaproteobacteria bacterium]
DNGQLLSLYTQAYQITPGLLFKNTIEKTANWVMREMQSPDGGYYSALDADSEGEEGKFYIWSPDEAQQLINNEKHFAIFAQCYGLNQPANFEGRWHLHQYHTFTQLAKQFDIQETEIQSILQTCENKLFEARAKRIRPGLDDKILTSWNALMIHGMCQAGRILNRPEYISSAQSALHFIKHHLWSNKRLLATHKDGKSHLNAYLDDYAYLLLATTNYLQSEWDNDFAIWALEIADALLMHFEDKEYGGFFFTSHDHEQLIQRGKNFTDEAIPSGNGIAAFALQRLGLLTGKTEYLTTAENCIKAGADEFQQHAILCSSLLHALEEYLKPPTIIVLRGRTDNMAKWQTIFNQTYIPNALCFAIASDIEPIAPLNEKPAINDCCAYICEGTQCLPPITDIASFEQHIKQLQSNTDTQ